MAEQLSDKVLDVEPDVSKYRAFAEGLLGSYEARIKELVGDKLCLAMFDKKLVSVNTASIEDALSLFKSDLRQYEDIDSIQRMLSQFTAVLQNTPALFNKSDNDVTELSARLKRDFDNIPMSSRGPLPPKNHTHPPSQSHTYPRLDSNSSTYVPSFNSHSKLPTYSDKLTNSPSSLPAKQSCSSSCHCFVKSNGDRDISSCSSHTHSDRVSSPAHDVGIQFSIDDTESPKLRNRTVHNTGHNPDNGCVSHGQGNGRVAHGRGNGRVAHGQGNERVAHGQGNGWVIHGQDNRRVSYGQGNGYISQGQDSGQFSNGQDNGHITQGPANGRFTNDQDNGRVTQGPGNRHVSHDQGNGYILPNQSSEHSPTCLNSSIQESRPDQLKLKRLTSNASGSLEYAITPPVNFTHSLSLGAQQTQSLPTNGKKKSKKKHSKSFSDWRAELNEAKRKLSESETQKRQLEETLNVRIAEITTLKQMAKKTRKDHRRKEQRLNKQHNSEIKELKLKLNQVNNELKQVKSRKHLEHRVQMEEITRRENEVKTREIDVKQREESYHQQMSKLRQDQMQVEETKRILKTQQCRLIILIIGLLLVLLEFANIVFFLAYYKLAN